MPLVDIEGVRPVLMGDLSAHVEKGADGVLYIRPDAELGAYPRSMIDRLEKWATETPDQLFLADRPDGGEWRKLTYGQVWQKVRAVAQYLIDKGLSAERPLVILSGNSIEHALMALGALTAGVPYSPVSPPYALVSQDFAKLKHVFNLLTPGMVFVQEGAPYARAFDAVMTADMDLVVTRNPIEGRASHSFDDVVATPVTDAVDKAHGAVTPDTVTKFLFTSGSTGMPKAVINTQRMQCANQEMIATALAFLKEEKPVLVDWLPWNHTAGGNHNFGIVLYNGGSLYIDDGAPTPAGIAKSVRNLTEVSPTVYFNVPKGYEMLADRFEANHALRDSFFRDLKLIQYSGAGLSQHVWDMLESAAVASTGKRVMIITGYGSTETAPASATATWPVTRPGEVGLPITGITYKLLPNGEKMEVRMKGPNITPGYWRQPDKTAEAFDEEGFYIIHDALKFVDPDDVNKGLLFDGRVSEDYKLNTGTWVNMAGVRGALVKGFAPYVRDAVLTGLNQDYIGALLFTDHDAVRKIAPELADADDAAVAAHPEVRRIFQERLDACAAQSTGSSTLVARAIILDSPPSLDAHEVTDKGSINQRAVMAARAGLVDDLYTNPVPDHVMVAARRKKG
ncbi:MAG: feruloyl-CoA synthase [Notoacmeibacter sp.]|nr:feruloyl-CoA synthase [Notoacmeibacter sp.]MCC0033253.1 feruloyl-CoA synthase [Brucellaceae bacterium]